MSQQSFVGCFRELQEENRKKKPIAKATQAELRRRALAARRNLRWGRSLSIRAFETLSREEKHWLAKYECGELTEEKNAANEAYGHGGNIKHITTEDAVLYRVSNAELDAYFR